MNNKKIKMAGCALLMLYASGMNAYQVTSLKTEYMDRPIGMDVAHPRFSWQTKSDNYKSMQTAYRVRVASSEDNLRNGKYVYDSGRVASSDAVNIPYNGEALRPSTRYFWQVTVWDENGKESSSIPEWFETGLLGNDWHNALWIGSKNVDLSPYRGRYTIDYDFQIPSGSNKASFILGGKSDRQYVEVSFDTKNQTMEIARVLDGKREVRFSENISGKLDEVGNHHVTLDVSGPHSYSIQVSVDGNKIENTTPPPANRGFGPMGSGNKFSFSVNNDGPDEPNSNSRLYRIGFAQPEGQEAEFSNIIISEKAWGTTLYEDKKKHAVKGDGKPEMWQPGGEIAAPMLRKTVDIAKPVKKARLYSTARGTYEFEINGQKVGRDYLNPGWTDFRKRIMYNTFDVTPMLKAGKNGVGAYLGRGWFTDFMGFNPTWADQYGVRPSLMAMLDIEYEDGSKDVIVTDGTWRCSDAGPILENSLFNGEDYDASREIAGWSEGSYDDSSWDMADVIAPPAQTVIIQGYVGLPIRNNVTLTAKSVKKVGPKEYVYDMGQNLAGVPRIEGMKGKAGQTVTIHFAEMLYPEVIPSSPVAPYTIDVYKAKKGQLYRENYRSALSTDNYTMSGDPNGECYEPRFTYHGYRYLSLTGLDEPLPLENVKALALESIGDQKSDFITSNEDVNRLFSNCVWGQRGNFLAVPTDCPQRDERMGWTGDAQVFASAASYNMNTDPFYTRWLYTVRDDQNANGSYDGYYPLLGDPATGGASKFGNMPCGGWMEVGVVVPWVMYQQYGDTGILAQHYDSMVAFMDYLERNSNDFIQPFGGTGDWLAPVSTDTSLTNTCYSAYAADIMRQIALALGKNDDAERFSRLYYNIKDAFNRYFVNADGMTVVPASAQRPDDMWMSFAPDGGKPEQKKDANGNIIIDTQTSYVLPLQFGLISDDKKEKAVKHLHDAIERCGYTLTTGFVGTPYICLVLSDNGLQDDAYRLFTQTQYPSWLFPVKQGATTFWERWNSYTIENGFGPVSMNSFNHYAYGAIEEWIMSHCLGIKRDASNPGYRHFVLAPEIGNELDFAKGGFETMYGRVESSWQKKNGKVVCDFTVPANTTASLSLPGKDIRILDGKKGIMSYDSANGYELGSGHYSFEVKL